MNNIIGFWKILPVSTRFLLLAVVLAFIVLISLLVSDRTDDITSLDPSPTPVGADKLNVLQRSEPNTLFQNLRPQLSITYEEASADGSIVYTLESDNPARPDQITTKEGKVVFERIYIPDSPEAPGYMTLADVEQKHGDPEAVEQGSKFWGGFMKTYIYASSGYAFIANPHTREVFEMHVFAPTSVGGYKVNFGRDISGKEPVPEGL